MIDPKEVTALQQLIARSNDQAAYVRLFRIYFDALLAFAKSFVRSRQVAEEIVSDVFMQIWKIRAKLHTIDHLTIYLYSCIRNQSFNYLAKHKRQMTFMLDDESLAVPCRASDPEQLYITSELVKEIDQVIEQLPPQCRTIFRLIREDGLKYREVAEVLNISVKTVEAQIGIAMKKISSSIQPVTGKKNICQASDLSANNN